MKNYMILILLFNICPLIAMKKFSDLRIYLFGNAKNRYSNVEKRRSKRNSLPILTVIDQPASSTENLQSYELSESQPTQFFDQQKISKKLQ